MSAASRRAAASRCARASRARSSRVHFTDGEIVQQGQLLFTIDPRPFAAALAEARAGVATAQSELALAETDLGRGQPAAGRRGGVAERGRPADRRASGRRGQRSPPPRRGSVPARSMSNSPRSARRSAAASPTAGSTPATSSRRGRWQAARCSPRSTRSIRSTSPSTCRKSLFLKAARQRAGRRAPAGGRDPAAGRGRLSAGRAGSTSPTMASSQNSGTIRARAVVANPDYFLTPGMFGNMRLADGGTTAGAAGAGCGGPHRPGAQDRAGRRQGRHGRGQAGRDRPAGRRPARHPLGPRQGRPGRRPGRAVRHARGQGAGHAPDPDHGSTRQLAALQGAAAVRAERRRQATLAAN